MDLPPLVMHTVPATPVCHAYRAICVDTGARPTTQVAEIDGRRCYAVGEARVSRRRQGRTSYGVVHVQYLDDASYGRFTLADFNRRAKTPKPLPGDPT